MNIGNSISIVLLSLAALNSMIDMVQGSKIKALQEQVKQLQEDKQ